MIWPVVKDGYRKGENKQLDLRYSKYKKVNLFAGRAYHAALSQEEANVWRRSDRKERARIRMEKSRKKLNEAAKNGDVNAIGKVKRKKKRCIEICGKS